MNPEIPVTTREEPWISCLNSRWGPIPLLWLKRNPEAPIETWKEAWVPWGNMRASLRSPSQFKRNPELPDATQETPQDSPHNARWELIPLQWLKSNPTIPLATHKDTWIPWGNIRGSLKTTSQLKRIPQSSCQNLRKTTRFPPQCEMMPYSAAVTRENPTVPFTNWKEAWLPWGNMRGSLTSLIKFKRNPKLPAATWETPRDYPLNTRWGSFLLKCLESNPNFPLKTQKQACLPLCDSRGYQR